MTSVDTSDRDRTLSDVHTTLIEQGGRAFLGVGAPMAGKVQFLERLHSRADAAARDTLHIAATRGYARLDDSVTRTAAIIDCSPASVRTPPRGKSVGSPADLTGIGIPASSFLENAAPRPLVTLDSVSTLLAYSGEASVFRFLAVLTAQLRRVNGVGVFLIEDGCHDRQTVSTFQQLFDGRVDIEPSQVRIRGIDGISPGGVSR
ncbi:DUF7504 family protein [Halorarius litoreus]|uniref:DUF7504 family protein n=1 Tax=Halorarius litoreus TaxID=2962676 RepID=UPI0020CF0614|nr:hypothetical protein [Halorarius litoreus]